MLDDRERRAWLRLARTENVGPVTFAAPISRFGNAGNALEALPRLAARGGKAGNYVVAPDDEAARELENLAGLGGRLLASCEPDFPQGLAALDPPPPAAAVLGHVAVLKREMVAIVGARNASALARKFAFTMAQDLTAAGLTIASGWRAALIPPRMRARWPEARSRCWRAAWMWSIRRRTKLSTRPSRIVAP
jgi:DNA processing protein